MSGVAEPAHEGETFVAPATVVLFGYPDTPAAVTLLSRPRSWRVGRALRYAVGGLLTAPVVGLVPPHAPWAVGALVGGAVLARRRLQERLTLVAVEGTCPRCGRALLARSGRLRTPHPVPCEGCHHECAIDVSEEELPQGAATR